ncbi:MAG: hypothetical protein NVSMB17_18570 [Candidatus Dormibacteria bacterium]
MLDDIVETAIPWGGFLAVGALLGASFPEETRDLARRAAVLGMRLADRAREIGAESWERGQDILAEAQAEHDSSRRNRDDGPATRLTVVKGQGESPRRTPTPRPRSSTGTAAKAAPGTPTRRPRRKPAADS